MKLRHTMLSVLAVVSMLSLTGCSKQSLVSESMTSSRDSHAKYPALALHKPHHSNIPATVRLNTLQHSNTWYNLDMSDSLTGYRWAYISGRFSMESTANGGNAWHAVRLPTMSWTQGRLAAGTGQIENPHVTVVDASTVYIFTVSGNTLITCHTVDGGGHWEAKKLVLPETGLQLECIDVLGNKDAFALLRGNGKHELLHLQEGATKMAIQHIVPGHRDSGLSASAQAVVNFTNERRGWVLAVTSDGKLHLYESTNGGDSWQGRVLNAPTALNGYKAVRAYQPVQLEQKGTFIVRYAGSVNNQAQIKTAVFRTNDYGRHFTGQVVDILDDAAANYMGLPAYFETPDYGFAISDARLVTTQDQGSSWKTIHTPQLELALHKYPRVLVLRFMSDTTGFVLLQSADYKKNLLLHTADEGNHWVQVNS